MSEPAIIRCFICRAPSRRVSRFELTYLERHVYSRLSRRLILALRPLSAFGLCKRHRDQTDDGRRLFIGEDVRGEEPADKALRGISPRWPGQEVLVEVPERRRVSSKVRRTWRERLLAGRASCACGAPATEIGHAVPTYYFELCGHAPEDSFFEGNVWPSCKNCNQTWIWLNNPHEPRFREWPNKLRSLWQLRFTRAQSRSAAIGRRVLAIPDVPRHRWPGKPILGIHPNPTATEFEIVGFWIERYWALAGQLREVFPSFRYHGNDTGPRYYVRKGFLNPATLPGSWPTTSRYRRVEAGRRAIERTGRLHGARRS